MGNQNSRNSSSNPQGEGDDIADMKFENVISYVAAKYITQANFKDLQNLHKPDYCNKLVILTSKVIKHFLDDGEIIELGDTELHVLHTPGHTVDSCVFHIPSKHVIICGDLVPAAGHPVRADMPTGALMDLKSSLETVRDLHPNMLVCGRGDAISGPDVCASVLTYHIQSVDERITAKGEIPSGWPKPAQTCHWLTPEPSWNFD